MTLICVILTETTQLPYFINFNTDSSELVKMPAEAKILIMDSKKKGRWLENQRSQRP